MPKEQHHPEQPGPPLEPEHEPSDDPYLEGLVERLRRAASNLSSSTHNDTVEVSEKSFDIRELSEDAQKLWKVLRREMGDRELLPIHAEKLGFNLESALSELRSRGIIEESDLGVRIKMRRIK